MQIFRSRCNWVTFLGNYCSPRKKFIVGCVYRPPNQNAAMFIDKFNNILSLIYKGNKHCYVMGDFNLDLLQYNHHVPTQEFIDSLFSHAFLPLISNPTRLTSYSATLIDNIFTNNLAPSVFSGIILNDLSDHLPVFAYFDDATLTRSTERKVVMRTFNDDNLRWLPGSPRLLAITAVNKFFVLCK